MVLVTENQDKNMKLINSITALIKALVQDENHRQPTLIAGSPMRGKPSSIKARGFALCLAALLISTCGQAQVLFVANGNDNNIVEVAPNGTAGIFASGLSNPHGLAFDNAGNLYVSDWNNGTLLEFKPGGAESTIASGFNEPDGLAYDNQGDLFLADHATGIIYEFTNRNGTLSGNTNIFAGGLGTPYRLAFDGPGDLFVATGTSGKIYEFTNDNGTLSSNSTVFASGLTDPRGLAFDSAGNLFSADYESGNIYEFTPNGTRSTFASGLNYPFDLVFNGAGNLFVSSGQSQDNGDLIIEITPGGEQSTFVSGLIPLGLAFQRTPGLSSTAINGAFQLTVSMPSPDYPVVSSITVQSSTNLVNWNAIYTNIPPYTFTDSIASPCRFYRAFIGQ
jgi:sugar lactone lactonase YvrE